ncbi:lycopene cyclase [Sorangium sp. So ce1036]|uniref:lycopene cyclase n=1 Tax=Sorangium sp. So ce1036 TaxID=3133328 RepID=UPI003F06C2CA
MRAGEGGAEARELAEARERVRAAGGDALLARLTHLDGARGAPAPRPGPALRAPDRGARADYDVVIAGGGLLLLLAPLLASAGLRVAVLDRARVGAAHREWNAGTAELEALSASGLLAKDEVERLVVARYVEGLCRWHGGGTYPVRGALDHAIDAAGLLAAARARAEALGVALLDGHALVEHAEGPDAVALAVAEAAPGAAEGAPSAAPGAAGARPRALSARLLVDARGAASPYATADLVCPTVGGVLTGLAEGDGPRRIRPDVGEILATTEDVEEGRQHVWEAFPGRPGETTVYLFYYARAGDVGPGALLSLYARFFRLLPRYKEGDARLVRPTFGFIPGWTRLTAAPRAPGRRVRLVGDAAARHSPLTFCGFGASVRELATTAADLARAVEDPGAPRAARDAPVHSGTGALAALMARPAGGARAGEMNALLDTAFAVLHAMGNDAYAALLRDEMQPADFIRFLRETAARRPEVYREVVRALSLRALGRWGAGLARELLRSR